MLEYIYDDIIKKYHEAFYEEYQESDDFLAIEKKLNKAKNFVKLERIEFYLSTFFHHLRIDGTNLEIEIYKKASSKDSPGDFQQKKTLVRFINTFNKECLRLENYDFRLLFQKVRPKMLMEMFVSLLHERKIILIHNDSSKNAILIEALISLLYPLQWNFTNISYLIPSMTEYLEAPFPYIVGLPRDLWKYIYEQKWDILGDEVVAFDIDNNRTIYKEELPEFPQPYTQLLIKQLEIQLDKSKQISARGGMPSEDIKREEDKFWNNFTLKVKQQFLNFLIFLINTFENFYIKKEDSPQKSQQTIGGQGTAASTLDSSRVGNNQFSNGSANDIFNFDEYVQNVKENQSFFDKFVRTQAFINFIEQAFYEEQGNLNDASIRFFKECTRKLSKENLQAVRAMQDNMISALMHKFNDRGISYSIDKCHLIYEKALQLSEGITDKHNLKSKFGLIQNLNHNRIIQMQPFDPTQLITSKYSKQESIFDVQKLERQKSVKKHENQYMQFMSELNLADEPPSLSANAYQFHDYFTVQQTPTAANNITLDDNQEFNQNILSKTTHLIKIEDNVSQGGSETFIEERSNEGSSGDQEGNAGLFGFFKKTFSSVKKTFENTFSKKHSQSKSQSRPPAISVHVNNRLGALTPVLSNSNDQVQEEQSPTQTRKSVTQRAQNRAARSQTFHVQSQQPPQTRDRKNNNSFFANLLNLGSTSKKEPQHQSSLSPQKSVDDDIRRKNLSRSGFFIFNEEDMKNMTEMSPKNIQKKMYTNVQTIHFDLSKLDEQQLLSQRQQPRIKQPPILDGQTSYFNRMRSVSYQQAQQQNILLSNHNSNQKQKQHSRIMDLINNESNNSSIVEDPTQIYINNNFQKNRMTFAANSQLYSPVINRESRNAQHQQVDQNQQQQQILFNISAYNDASTLQDTASKNLPAGKNEFEEIYKKSTENLYYAPPNKNFHNGYNQKFNIWKSQSGRVNLNNNSGASQKPPKHQLKQQRAAAVAVQKAQPKISATKTVKSEDKLVLQKSQQSETYNDRNSTDEDLKAPIMGKNLSSFKNIMGQNGKYAFEKQGATASNQIKKGSSNQNKQTTGMKHKRQLSSSVQQIFKGETNNPIGSPILENIEPDEAQYSSKQQIESLQIGRVRKKSGTHNMHKVGSNNKLRKGSNNPLSQQKPTLQNQNTKSIPITVTSTFAKSSKNSLSHAQQQSSLSSTLKQPLKQTNTPSSIANSQLHDSVLRQPQQQQQYQTVQQHHHQHSKTVQSTSNYSSCQSQISSNGQSIAIVNSSKVEIHKYKLKSEEYKQELLPSQLQQELNKINNNDSTSNFDDESQLSFKSHSDLPNQTYSYINLVNRSIDFRDSQKGDLIKMQSQQKQLPMRSGFLQSPTNAQSMQREFFNQQSFGKIPSMVVLKSNQNEQIANNLSSQNQQLTIMQPGGRMHSLSQHAKPFSDINNHQFSNLKPQNINDTNVMNSNKQITNSKLSSNQKFLSDIFDIVNSQNLNIMSSDNNRKQIPQIGFKQNLKPLNKITWEAFSQIAKLSGDTDHEPHTPKSGGVGNMSDCEDIEE